MAYKSAYLNLYGRCLFFSSKAKLLDLEIPGLISHHSALQNAMPSCNLQLGHREASNRAGGCTPLSVTLKFKTGEQVTSVPSIVMLPFIAIPMEARTTPVFCPTTEGGAGMKSGQGHHRKNREGIPAGVYYPSALKYLKNTDRNSRL